MRLWPKSEEDDEFNIPAPDRDGITAILEYSMDEDEAEIPTGVTIPGEETISPSGWGFTTAGDGETYVRGADGEWKTL